MVDGVCMVDKVERNYMHEGDMSKACSSKLEWDDRSRDILSGAGWDYFRLRLDLDITLGM